MAPHLMSTPRESSLLDLVNFGHLWPDATSLSRQSIVVFHFH
jgi:hypothetical protein